MTYSVNHQEVARWRLKHRLVDEGEFVEIDPQHITNGTHVCINPGTRKSVPRRQPLHFFDLLEIHLSYFQRTVNCLEFFDAL